jgi:hypothetical protein
MCISIPTSEELAVAQDNYMDSGNSEISLEDSVQTIQLYLLLCFYGIGMGFMDGDGYGYGFAFGYGFWEDNGGTGSGYGLLGASGNGWGCGQGDVDEGNGRTPSGLSRGMDTGGKVWFFDGYAPRDFLIDHWSEQNPMRP